MLLGFISATKKIRSYGFERGIGSTPLLAKISDKSTHKVFSKYGIDEELLRSSDSEQENQQKKDIKFLNDYFYLDLNWAEFEKMYTSCGTDYNKNQVYFGKTY